MVPLFVDVGWLGSVTDVGTFVLVLVTWVYDGRVRLNTLSAAAVALAREHESVDDERLASDLDVEERDVSALQTTLIGDGGEN